MQHNEMHFKKVKESNVCKDKIYQQIKHEIMRDLMLKGKLKREDCNDENVFEFLNFLSNEKK